MASAPTVRTVFVDSSVFIAAAISPKGSARDLVIAGTGGRFRLIVSALVLLETERNLANKASVALPAFHTFRQLLSLTRDPTKAQAWPRGKWSI